MRQASYRSIKKQLYFALSAIAVLTLLTVLVANYTAKQLSDAYQRAADQFVPLMQAISNLQSSSANLKSELFALKSKQDDGDTMIYIERVKAHWQQIEQINSQILQSELLDIQRNELEQRNLRIRQYIVHTDHLAQLFVTRNQVNNHKQLMTPQVLALLRNTEEQLLPKMGVLSEQLAASLGGENHSHAEHHGHHHADATRALNEVRNFFNIYKRALLMAELLVEANALEDSRELNKIKRKVHQLANSIEQYAALADDSQLGNVAFMWLDQAQHLYKGTISVFNTQLNYIRTEKVIDSLIAQQVDTADELLLSSEKIRVYLQSLLSEEADSAERNLKNKQAILWLIAVVGVVFSAAIGWLFIHRQVIDRVTKIRTNMIELSYGNTSMDVVREYKDELGDMEEALVLLQGYVEQVQTMATTDPLTQLFNRRLFESTLSSEIARCQSSFQPLALLILDIDYFKQYNDIYGHPVGDGAIVDIANILKAHCQHSNNFLARIGGEEFAVILPNVDVKEARIIADNIQTSVQSLYRIHKGSAISDYLTLSIGIKVVGGENNMTTEQVYSLADAALYRAKEVRNCIVVN
ncbi:GGDEF domain-containing protein [Thaumasiovibrio subtropicus]|uniref:GGDEF domain-containing protein n=1 Tax=Thaumasiovibrio subtropicus TaxID=1891207 RepID=UPI000B3591B1|nr:GGDEF domain-containing protein [Thaumasiovibrio subtropicus]